MPRIHSLEATNLLMDPRYVRLRVHISHVHDQVSYASVTVIGVQIPNCICVRKTCNKGRNTYHLSLSLIYTSLVMTPLPTKLEAAKIVGTLSGYTRLVADLNN